ncbi:MAG: flippase-like domain-containing protein [Magnetospirillum sp. WYHS-4]
MPNLLNLRSAMSKKWIAISLKVLLSGLLIWYLFRNVDVGAAYQRARGLDPWLGLGTLALFLFQSAIGGWRWNAALAAIGEPLSFWRSFVLCYIGAFFNQTLPSAVGGDAVRMYKARHDGLSLSAAINGVMLDRVSTVVALVFLVVGLQPLLLAKVDLGAAEWLFPLLSLGALAGLGVLMMLDRMPESLRRWKIVRGLAYLATDTRRLFLVPRHAARSLFFSAIGHVNISVAVWVLARALAIDISVVDCLILIPLVILITTLPISIGGWGVREGAMVGTLGLVGVPAESALVLSILFGLSAMVTALPGGVFWLMDGGRRTDLALDEIPVDTALPADGEN